MHLRTWDLCEHVLPHSPLLTLRGSPEQQAELPNTSAQDRVGVFGMTKL